jgi:hypothetical protein
MADDGGHAPHARVGTCWFQGSLGPRPIRHPEIGSSGRICTYNPLLNRESRYCCATLELAGKTSAALALSPARQAGVHAVGLLTQENGASGR